MSVCVYTSIKDLIILYIQTYFYKNVLTRVKGGMRQTFTNNTTLSSLQDSNKMPIFMEKKVLT